MRARLALGFGLAIGLVAPRPAAAWDPATTHLGMVDRAVLESIASEFGARMIAMENATKNAGEIISALTFQYNRAR